MKIVDIGANLLDDMFKGVYNNRKCHPPDLEHVLHRAKSAGVDTIIVTAGSIQDCRQAQDLLQSVSTVRLFTTAGIHPTRASEIMREDKQWYERLCEQAKHQSVVAIGECGLDYFREFSTRQDQIEVFTMHFDLAQQTQKPMFLHLRQAFEDFHFLLCQNRAKFTHGVVHSFDGTVLEALQLVQLGLHIGINGCSVRLPLGLEVIKAVPLEWLMVESDAPWCDIRPTHASHSILQPFDSATKKDKDKWSSECMVKGRNEPMVCRDLIVLISRVKNIPLETVWRTCYQTSCAFFQI